MWSLLDEASSNVVIEMIRKEVKPKQDDIEDEGSEQEEEESLVPKKPQRRVSKTLLAIIHKHFPTLECSSDSGCFLAVIANQIKQFDFKSDSNQDKLREKLVQVQSIVRVMQPTTSTQRKYFVELTYIFKTYWVARGETPKAGRHISVVRDLLRAEKSVVSQHIQEKEQLLYARLKDKFHESYADVQDKTLRAYDRVMAPGKGRVTNDDLAALGIALETSCGMRKIEYIDPFIEYLTYAQWQKRQQKKGLSDMVFRIGTNDDDADDPHEDSIAIRDKDMFASDIGMEWVIVQIGVGKDSATQINQFIDADDERWVHARVLVKPSIILTAQQIVKGVKQFRSINNFTKANFKNRKHQSSKWGTNQVAPVLREMYPVASAQAKANNWSFGTHYARKLYANISFDIYEAKIRTMTSKYIDRSIWMKDVLGHGGGITTSLSYSNVVISYKMDNEVYALPAPQQMRVLLGQIERLTERLNELENNRNVVASEQVLDENIADVSFMKPDGSIVTLKKHRRQILKNAEDKDKATERVFNALTENGIPITNSTLMKMGIGRKTISAYKNKHNLTIAVPASSDHEPEPEAVVPKKRKLPVGAKVIMKQAKNQATTDKLYTDDVARFGEENILLNAEDCTGTIQKDVALSNRLKRDLCVEKM